MKLVVLKDADSVALSAARTIAADAREAFAARGRFALAVSGGHTPWIMLRALAVGRRVIDSASGRKDEP
jgi:6-phosphogluconolactonase